MILKISAKSPRWAGSRSARAARRPASSSATIIRRTFMIRSESKNICSVRQADPLRAELERGPAVQWRLRIGAHAQPAHGVGPGHERAEIADQFGLDRGHGAEHDLARGAVDGDDLAFLDDMAADAHAPGLMVDGEHAGARHAGPAHAARDHGGVAGHAAPRREYPLRGMHAVNVLRRGLGADEDHLLAGRGPLLGGVGVEHRLAAGRAGRGGQALGNHLAVGLGVERRVEQLVERGGIDPQHRFVPRDQPLLRHIDGDPQGGFAGALAGAGLQHPQAAALDGELDILHVAIMALEVGTRASSANTTGIDSSIDGARAEARSRAARVRYCGVRMPATTSSPWALIRYSP